MERGRLRKEGKAYQLRYCRRPAHKGKIPLREILPDNKKLNGGCVFATAEKVCHTKKGFAGSQRIAISKLS